VAVCLSTRIPVCLKRSGFFRSLLALVLPVLLPLLLLPQQVLLLPFLLRRLLFLLLRQPRLRPHCLLLLPV
jgi:hypothetical protein